MVSGVRRIVAWVLGTVAGVVLLFQYPTSTSSALPAATTTAAAPPAAGPTNTATGSVAQTRWGPVQVRITVSAGRITDVTVLQQPDGNRKDQEINADALPVLIHETLTAQSADVDAVSGATVTSDGYTQSLQSAIDQAGLPS